MQKFRLVDDKNYYGRKSRKERDRPGGHAPTVINNKLNGWKELAQSDGRKFCKKVFAKQARREHQRIVAEAILEYEESNALLMEESCYDYEDDYGDWNDYPDEWDDWDHLRDDKFGLVGADDYDDDYWYYE